MNRAALSLLVPLWLAAAGGSSCADDQKAPPDRHDVQGDRLNLADLAGYRAALSGRATADDAHPADQPVPVRFRDLWGHAGAFEGRRVTVQGRVERIFRQGPLGSFPPLAEAWIFSTAGDPFCLVFPLALAGAARGDGEGQEGGTAAPAGPDPGRTVRFTGTFLKMIRYAGGDGARLAPLIVGDRPPQAAPGSGKSTAPGVGAVLRAIGGDGAGPGGSSWPPASWGLALVALLIFTASLLARHSLHGTARRDRSASRLRARDQMADDPPLRFIDSGDEPPG